MRSEAALTLTAMSRISRVAPSMRSTPLCESSSEDEEYCWVSLALSEMWLMLTVISSIAAAIEDVASDCLWAAWATSREEVLICSAPRASWPESALMSRIIRRSAATIWPIESSMLPLGAGGISPERSPVATRAMMPFATSGSPPTWRRTLRVM